MEEKLKPFIEEYSDDFYESIEDIRQYLMKYNKNYRELSAGECKDLSQVIVLYNNLQDILEKEIYFKGGMDSYYYFKRIGVIK